MRLLALHSVDGQLPGSALIPDNAECAEPADNADCTEPADNADCTEAADNTYILH